MATSRSCPNRSSGSRPVRARVLQTLSLSVLLRRRARPFVEELEARTLLAADALPDVFLRGDVEIFRGPRDPGSGGGVGYNLAKIQASQAWTVTTGRADVVVANIDSGIDYSHPDLYLNVWINQYEIPQSVLAALTDTDHDDLITFYDLNDPVNQGQGKARDLDGNDRIDAADLLRPASDGGWADGLDQDPFSIAGRDYSFVDDLIGWDFINTTASRPTGDNQPLDQNGHGTHTAGVIGARNDSGGPVQGLNRAVSIMSLQIIAADGSGSVDAAIDAIYYAVHHDVRVSNNSWGVSGFYQPLYDAIAFAGSHGEGQVFVAAAGNNGLDNDRSPLRTYPASFALDNIIAVTATNATDGKPRWANTGATSVDLGAPGVDILSTVPNGYAYGSGTSMAAPHVTGSVALLLAQARAQNQGLTAGDLKARILDSVDPVSSLAGRTVTGGRLNVARALTSTATAKATTTQTEPRGGRVGSLRAAALAMRAFQEMAGATVASNLVTALQTSAIALSQGGIPLSRSLHRDHDSASGGPNASPAPAGDFPLGIARPVEAASFRRRDFPGPRPLGHWIRDAEQFRG